MNKSITLLETLFSLVILSIILITSANLNILLFKQNKHSNELLLAKLDFETTRLFLENKIKSDLGLENLSFNDNIIYYNKNILLLNIDTYKKDINNNLVNLNICIKRSFEICQNIKVKNDF